MSFLTKPMASAVGATFGVIEPNVHVTPKPSEADKAEAERQALRKEKIDLKKDRPGRQQTVLTQDDSAFPYRLY